MRTINHHFRIIACCKCLIISSFKNLDLTSVYLALTIYYPFGANIIIPKTPSFWFINQTVPHYGPFSASKLHIRVITLIHLESFKSLFAFEASIWRVLNQYLLFKHKWHTHAAIGCTIKWPFNHQLPQLVSS